MTTPAVNEDIITPITSTLQTKACTGSVITNVTSIRDGFRKRRVRPMSVTNPVIHGWRNPSSFSSFGFRTNPVPDVIVTDANYGACTMGNHSDTYYVSGYSWNAGISNLPNVPAWMVGSAVSRALLKLKNQDVNLSVAFAERKETEQLFTDTVHHIADSVKSYRRARSKGVWDVIKGEGGRSKRGGFRRMPQDWLELQYGWNPLMSDVDGACNALSKKDTPLFFRAMSNVVNKSSILWTKSGPLAFKMNIEDRLEQRVRVVLYYELDNPVVVKFAQLGLTNPLELAWERLKYSFVIDWFIPVGNWLSTLDADFGWKFKAGARTEFTRVKSRVVGYEGNQSSTSHHYSFGGADYVYDGYNFVRATYPSSPWAGAPSFKNPLSGKHIANALSLLVQAFR